MFYNKRNHLSMCKQTSSGLLKMFPTKYSLTNHAYMYNAKFNVIKIANRPVSVYINQMGSLRNKHTV